MENNNIQQTIKMSEVVTALNEATAAYDAGKPIMSDEAWDNLYFILQTAERQTGVILPNSPTQIINYELKTELTKVQHNHEMLSLDKTKNINEVNEFIDSKPSIAMCKLDGLTLSLKYENGRLVSAETRGNGFEGEDVTHNALAVSNIPNKIVYKDTLIVDGEIICKYDDFEYFKEYKNPRNFAAGSIRLLDAKECASRRLSFLAWDVIEGFESCTLLSEKLEALKALGFFIVPYILLDSGTEITDDIIRLIKMAAIENYIPIDGAVFKFNNIEYGKSLGKTSHHFKNAIAFKFYDDAIETTLKSIEFTMGRTGVLTPVAVFDPVDIEGSTVERASLHNLSIMHDTLGPHPFYNEKIQVIKSNMIIPQIVEADFNNNENQEEILLPEICPVCGGETSIETSDSGVLTLICTNPECPGKLINKLDHFCGKKGLNIKGLSKATLEKLINWGWINCLSDIFTLYTHQNEWINKSGFGEKSVNKILAAIKESKNCNLENFICAIGIPLVGQSVSKEIVKHVSSYADFRKLIDEQFDFTKWAGFAENKASYLLSFDYSEADEIINLLTISTKLEQIPTEGKLFKLNFVITGKLETFKNREELVKQIEAAGGKVSGSVSSKTNYLINNDKESTSTKNINAKKLGVEIISEQEFLEKFDF